MTGMTLTRGDKRRINSMSISLNLIHQFRRDVKQNEANIQHVRVSGGRNEVQKGMDPVIPETRITDDAGLLCEDIIILTLEVTNDFLETIILHTSGVSGRNDDNDNDTYANSLSMLFPKPGVSTIVRAMRTPSSSNSALANELIPHDEGV